MENIRCNRLITAPGFRDDCINLLNIFEASIMKTFKRFCEIWREMKFTNVYWNRMTETEMRNFCEEALAIVKDFVTPSQSLIRRIGAVFLLYGLRTKTPLKGFKIRVTIDDWICLLALRDMLFKQSQNEAVFILNKLIESHSFEFCVAEYELGPGKYFWIQKDFIMENMMQRPPSVSTDELLSIFNDVSKLNEQYSETKLHLAHTATAVIPTLHNSRTISDLMLKFKNLYTITNDIEINHHAHVKRDINGS